MTAGPTLHSRLRVLVAKAFRAEKLYSSSGFGAAASGGNGGGRSDRLTNVAILAEAASEIRAKEWQRSHYQLRTALNEILGLGNHALIVQEVAKLRDVFAGRAAESAVLVEKGAEDLIETAKRHEFAHIFKISLELIRFKAQAQANRVIADELTALLEATGATVLRETPESAELPVVIRRYNELSPGHAQPRAAESEMLAADSEDTAASAEGTGHSNVIEFRSRMGQRARRR